MSYPSAAFSVTLDGKDVTSKIYSRLVSLTLTESREDSADQLDITIDDSDGKVAIPRRGVKIDLKLGWKHTGMVDKGTFLVDEVEHSGTPDTIILRARSAAMMTALRTRKERSFHQQTISAIVSQIARENGLVARIGDFGGVTVDHIDQTNESDLNFLKRLGKRHDAVATIKKDTLLFLPIGNARTSLGHAMPTITLSRKDGDKHRYHIADRDAYTGVTAYWQDPDKAKRTTALAGTKSNAKRLRNTYANAADAKTAAVAEWQRIQRGGATFEYILALGRADLAPMTSVSFPDFKDPIGDIEWQIAKCTHSVTTTGFTTQIEMEMKFSQGQENSYEASRQDDVESDEAITGS